MKAPPAAEETERSPEKAAGDPQHAEFYRRLLDACPDPVIAYDAAGAAVHVNHAFTRTFGEAGEWAAPAPGGRGAEVQKALTALLRGETVPPFETSQPTKGGITNFEITPSLLRDAAGKPCGGAFFCRDISARRRSQGAFPAETAHDLLNPLNAILGAVQMMQRDHGLAADHRECLDAVRRNGECLLRLINAAPDPSDAGRPDSESPAPEDQKRRQVAGLAPGQPAWRILVVEDHAPNRILLATLLRMIGFDVQEARDGKEAVDRYRRWRPHLIWMDMRMPNMDGYEATRKIRELETGDKRQETEGGRPVSCFQSPVSISPVSIIALTASVFAEKREMILAAGCDDFVKKPFQESEILEKMRQHLGVRYVYADACGADAVADAAAERPLTPADMAALSPEARGRLARAVTTGSLDQIEGAVAAVGREHPGLARAVKALADRFEYRTLRDLIAQAEASA